MQDALACCRVAMLVVLECQRMQYSAHVHIFEELKRPLEVTKYDHNLNIPVRCVTLLRVFRQLGQILRDW